MIFTSADINKVVVNDVGRTYLVTGFLAAGLPVLQEVRVKVSYEVVGGRVFPDGEALSRMDYGGIHEQAALRVQTARYNRTTR